MEGKIYFKKNIIKENKFEANKKSKNYILNYLKTKKADYDRIIILYENQLLNLCLKLMIQ